MAIDIVDELAGLMLHELTFDSTSFQDARTCVRFRDETGAWRHIRYDQLTLYIYEHSLSPALYDRLQTCLNNRYPALPAQVRKTHNEYKILMRFVQDILRVEPQRVCKRESPDFALHLDAGVPLGVEITELITEQDARAYHNVPMDFGTGRRVFASAGPQLDRERVVTGFGKKLAEKYQKVQSYPDSGMFSSTVVVSLCEHPRLFRDLQDYRLLGRQLQDTVHGARCDVYLYSFDQKEALLWKVYHLGG